MIDYVQSEQKVEQGEWFYTSGDDRIFPKGLPVGEVTVVRPGKAYQQIFVTPSGMQNGLEEVLVVVEGVHGAIPENPPGFQPVHLQDPPPPEVSGELPALPVGPPSAQSTTARSGSQTTDADKMVERYRQIGEAEKRVYGQNGGGAPNFNINLAPVPPAPAAQPAPSSPAPASPAAKRP
jgi:rod shape-determining protein MreC